MTHGFRGGDPTKLFCNSWLLKIRCSAVGLSSRLANSNVPIQIDNSATLAFSFLVSGALAPKGHWARTRLGRLVPVKIRKSGDLPADQIRSTRRGDLGGVERCTVPIRQHFHHASQAPSGCLSRPSPALQRGGMHAGCTSNTINLFALSRRARNARYRFGKPWRAAIVAGGCGRI